MLIREKGNTKTGQKKKKADKFRELKIGKFTEFWISQISKISKQIKENKRPPNFDSAK